MRAFDETKDSYGEQAEAKPNRAPDQRMTCACVLLDTAARLESVREREDCREPREREIEHRPEV